MLAIPKHPVILPEYPDEIGRGWITQIRGDLPHRFPGGQQQALHMFFDSLRYSFTEIKKPLRISWKVRKRELSLHNIFINQLLHLFTANHTLQHLKCTVVQQSLILNLCTK